MTLYSVLTVLPAFFQFNASKILKAVFRLSAVFINAGYPYNHSFSLSAWYSINSMCYSTLYYKTGFVLADFAQL